MRSRWLIASAVAVVASCAEPVVLLDTTQTDVFTQEVRRAVDILLVVDNSCSMIDEQDKLSRNFDAFIEQFLTAEVDYQIGVVTTDLVNTEQNGRLVGDPLVISSALPIDDARTAFERNVKVCATGSGLERGLEAARRALSEPLVSTENAGFLREDAALSVVFVSDEEDGSGGPVDEYLTFFKGLKGDRGFRDDGLVNLSAVVGPPPDGCRQPAPVLPNCVDGLDEEDGDGLVDCDDPDCMSAWECSFPRPEASCTDGQDDDGDGAIDCADADCGASGACRELDCADGIDGDSDGAVDCRDADCLVEQPGLCGELSCDDGGLEHHGADPYPNLLADCRDPSCFTDPDLQETCLAERAPIDYAERCELAVRFDELTATLVQSDGPDVDEAQDLEHELAGCADPDCATFWLCQPGPAGTPGPVAEPEAACGDCVDNDADGLEDCNDRDCKDSVYCDNPYPIDPGIRYIDVALRSGGIVTSICSEEFSSLVRELGLTISGLRDTFYLTAWPRIDTLKVYDGDVDPAHELTEGWLYEPVANAVRFEAGAIPPPGTTLRLRYTRSPRPPTDQGVTP